MRIGTLCFATERGLGYLAKSFYTHGVVTDVAVLHHGRIPTLYEWYPSAIQIKNKPFLDDDLKDLINRVGVMLFFETPFDWYIIDYCRQVGVKTALITMYECTPQTIPAEPDLFICPSELDMRYFPKDKSVLIPIPVEEPWNFRTTATNFVHNSGYIGLRGRSGTKELLEAVKYLKTPLKLTVRSQDLSIARMAIDAGAVDNPNFTVEAGTVPYNTLRIGMDVCVAPEKFNGLSLPLQECYASGMLVITTKRFPATTWLPTAPMIPVRGYSKQRVASRFIMFDEATVDPIEIARSMDSWYGKDITEYSLAGQQWAKTMSWKVLKPRYMEALLALC